MIRTDFSIGKEFWCGGHKWLCTDIGTRVITAIRVSGDHDIIEVVSPDGTQTVKTLDEDAMRNGHWFDGPPYQIEEGVFDEDDQKDCSANEPIES